MLNIKCFNDNDRFVVVFDGLKEVNKDYIVKNVLTGVMQQCVDSTAKAVPKETQPEIAIPATAPGQMENNKEEKEPGKVKPDDDGCTIFGLDRKASKQVYEYLLEKSNEDDILFGLIRPSLERYFTYIMSQPIDPDKMSVKGLNFLIRTQYILYNDTIKAELKSKYGFEKKHTKTEIGEDKHNLLVKMAKTILSNL